MTAASINENVFFTRQWTAPFFAYGAFVLACTVLLHPTAFEMVNLWAGSSAWRHGFFIAPIALWMIYNRRDLAPPPKANLKAAGLVLAAALLWLLGRSASIALIEQFAFVSLLIAGVAAIFGLAVIRVYAFPLAFLYFMVPFGEMIIPALQEITTTMLIGFLNSAGMAVVRDGFLIETPGGVFNIAAACAGLNFLLAAIIASAFVSYAWFERWRKRLAFIAIAVTAAIATNIFRVFLIIFFAAKTPETWNLASDHFAFGLALYAAMIAILFVIGRRMADHPRQDGV